MKTFIEQTFYLANLRCAVLFIFLFSAQLTYGNIGAEDSISNHANSENLTSLVTILNEDGTLNLASDFTGSLDPSGFSLISKEGEAPRFAPIVGDPDDNWFTNFGTDGLNSSVSTIYVDGSNLYVGGDFTTAGDVVANRIAKWDGLSWSALGTGLNSTVNAIFGDG